MLQPKPEINVQNGLCKGDPIEIACYLQESSLNVEIFAESLDLTTLPTQLQQERS